MSGCDKNHTDSISIEESVRAELVILLFRSPAVPLINGLVTVITAGILWHTVPVRFSVCWSVISFLLVVARLVLWSQFNRRASEVDAGQNPQFGKDRSYRSHPLEQQPFGEVRKARARPVRLGHHRPISQELCIPRSISRILCIFAALGAFSLGSLTNVRAQDERQLKSLRAIHSLSNKEASQELPVAFEGTVTYFEAGNVDLFVQNRGIAVYVETPPHLNLHLGDRVLIGGKTRASFRPEIVANRVTVSRHGLPPLAVSGSFGQLIKAELDCRRVSIRGTVQGANLISDGASKSLLMDILMDGGYIQAQVANGVTNADVDSLLDRRVSVTGAAAGRFDGKAQMTGALIEVQSIADVHILDKPQNKPELSRVRSFDEILEASRIVDNSQRVRVQGTITYYQPGAAMVIDDGGKTLWVDTLTEAPHRLGDRVIVSGFSSVRNGSVILARGHIERTVRKLQLLPSQKNAIQLASGASAFHLVSIEGRLIMQVRDEAQDQYVIAAQDHVFSAIYRHPERGLGLPLEPMWKLRIGSTVRVTGICVPDRGDQFQGPVAFHMLLRNGADVAQISGPPIISIRNLAILAALLMLSMSVAIGRSLLLSQRLYKQNAATINAVERWRTRVIDGINQAIPLRDTMVQITDLLTFKYHADYCWAEVDGEGVFGNCPPESARNALLIKEMPIPARSGESLGKIYAGFLGASKPRGLGDVALENATRLAALAIETGSKYSDLVRRSEIDPLTEAHNRFAFERALDKAILQSSSIDGQFGVIYIDLDKFKEINDRYGHMVGDQYLQNVALRLRSELRPFDTLARLGGDEFAVIVQEVHGTGQLDDIVKRLYGCFDSIFLIDGFDFEGSASIGSACFPEDGKTRQELLDRADSRMYSVKRVRHSQARASGWPRFIREA